MEIFIQRKVQKVSFKGIAAGTKMNIKVSGGTNVLSIETQTAKTSMNKKRKEKEFFPGKITRKKLKLRNEPLSIGPDQFNMGVIKKPS